MRNLKYKLICIDLDGTLLNDNKEVSIENIKIIQEAIKKGVVICITTGRILKFVDKYNDILNISTPVIASNGSIIYYNNEEFEINSLTLEEILEIKKIASKYNVDVYLNTDDSVICEKKIPSDYSYKVLNEKVIDKYKVKVIENYPFEKLFSNGKSNVVKAICINKNDLEEIRKVRKELEESGKFQVSSAEYEYCEINPKGVSKGGAVEKLAKKLNIEMDEVICIGDGGNDLEMLKKAGFSVAMKNGMISVKEIADYITESNNDNGVGKVIKDLVLND